MTEKLHGGWGGSVSHTQGAIVAAVLLLASKCCTLPSVAAEIAGSKATWVVLLLLLPECIALTLALGVARKGGLFQLDLPRRSKITVAGIALVFFTLKLAAFLREITTYYALSLFEGAAVLPLSVLLLVFLAVFSRKGYSAIGRTLEIFAWLFFLVILFVIIFARTEGHLFNAVAMVNPDFDGVPKALFSCLGWYGDAAIFLFLDVRGEPKEKPKSKHFALAITLSVVALGAFFALFTSVYGDAAKMTDYAFMKISAFKANTDELGSIDWPVITLWSILTSAYLALLFLSAKACVNGIKEEAVGRADGGKVTSVLLCLVALAISTFVIDETTRYVKYMTTAMSALALAALLITIVIGVLSRKKEVKNV